MPGPLPKNGVRALTAAEQIRAYRERRKAAGVKVTKPAVVVRYRKPADRCSKPQRWRDAVAEVVDLQADYVAWLDALPASLRDSDTADALRAICDFVLSELEGRAASAVTRRNAGAARRAAVRGGGRGVWAPSSTCRRLARWWTKRDRILETPGRALPQSPAASAADAAPSVRTQ